MSVDFTVLSTAHGPLRTRGTQTDVCLFVLAQRHDLRWGAHLEDRVKKKFFFKGNGN